MTREPASRPPLSRRVALISVLQAIIAGTLLGILLAGSNPELATMLRAPLIIGTGIIAVVQIIVLGRGR